MNDSEYRGTTTAYKNAGSLCCFVSRYALHDATIQAGDELEWHWDEAEQQLVGEVVTDG